MTSRSRSGSRVDRDDPAQRGVEVGEEVERLVDRRDELVAGVVRIEERDGHAAVASSPARRPRPGSRGRCRARSCHHSSRPSSETSGLKPHSGCVRAWRRPRDRPRGPHPACGSAAPCRGSGRRARRRPAALGSGRRRTRRRRASTPRPRRTCSTGSCPAVPRPARGAPDAPVCASPSPRRSSRLRRGPPLWDAATAVERGRPVLAQAIRIESTLPTASGPSAVQRTSWSWSPVFRSWNQGRRAATVTPAARVVPQLGQPWRIASPGGAPSRGPLSELVLRLDPRPCAGASASSSGRTGRRSACRGSRRPGRWSVASGT